MSALFMLLLNALWINVIESVTITNPSTTPVICAAGETCDITCDQTSICKGYEFRFEENSNVTLNCIERGSCREAIIISDAIDLRMYFMHSTDYAYVFLSGYAFINVYPNGHYETHFEQSQNAYFHYESALYKTERDITADSFETNMKTLQLDNINASYGIVNHFCEGQYACYGQFIYALSIYQINLHCNDGSGTMSCGVMEFFAPYNNMDYFGANIYGTIENRQSFYAVKGLRQINFVDHTSSTADIICYYDFSQSCTDSTTISACASDTYCGTSNTYQYPTENVSTLYTYYDYHQLIYTKNTYDIDIDITDQTGNHHTVFIILPSFTTDANTNAFAPLAMNRRFNLNHKHVTIHPTHHKTVERITINAAFSETLYIQRSNGGNDRFVDIVVYGPSDLFYWRSASWYNAVHNVHSHNTFYLQNTADIRFDCDGVGYCFAADDEIYIGEQTNININCGTSSTTCTQPTLWSNVSTSMLAWSDPNWDIQCGTGSCSSFRCEFGLGYCYINATLNECVPFTYYTDSPTSDPTMDPTVDPTKDPTTNPTSYPTIYPTVDPTKDPTSNPTSYPTVDPTVDPTKDPTLHPTIYPSSGNTVDPTTDPTQDPITDPTINPTSDPTTDPSVDPTVEPTTNPTEATIGPTKKPTAKPNRKPTVKTTENLLITEVSIADDDGSAVKLSVCMAALFYLVTTILLLN